MTNKTRPTGRVSTLIERRDRFVDRSAVGRPFQIALLQSNDRQAKPLARQAQAA
ncbi:hypothetical protein [Nevskia ramosa]|uniref:hypothetical protein n=1 Tax=Nevskia ramosa TaxID=64002 RepID=UPI000425A7EB|nr:hypothetical protein [Nevskia ramosa]